MFKVKWKRFDGTVGASIPLDKQASQFLIALLMDDENVECIKIKRKSDS